MGPEPGRRGCAFGSRVDLFTRLLLSVPPNLVLVKQKVVPVQQNKVPVQQKIVLLQQNMLPVKQNLGNWPLKGYPRTRWHI